MTKKDYFKKYQHLNKQNVLYRTFCKRIEGLPMTYWPAGFKSMTAQEKKDLIKQAEAWIPLVQPKKTTKIKPSRNQIAEQRQAFYKKHKTSTSPSYRTFRDRITQKGMTMEEAISWAKIGKIKAEIKQKKEQAKEKKVEVLQNIAEKTNRLRSRTDRKDDKIEEASLENLISDVSADDLEKKIETLVEYKESKKNICRVYKKINKTSSIGYIEGIYIILEEITDDLYEIMNPSGTILRILESKFIKRIS